MKIGGIVRCYHLTDYLAGVLKSLEKLDKVILANYIFKREWDNLGRHRPEGVYVNKALKIVGNEWIEDDDTESICNKLQFPNVQLKKGEDLLQREIFEACQKELEGFDYIFIIDADEILLPYDQEKIVDCMVTQQKDAAMVTVLDYVPDLKHIYTVRSHRPVVCIKPPQEFEGTRHCRYSAGKIFPNIFLHHFGYTMKDLEWKRNNLWYPQGGWDNIVCTPIAPHEMPSELKEILRWQDSSLQ